MTKHDSGFSDAIPQPSYSAVIKHEGSWWIGWVEEIPGVNCQEATREALIESLREALVEALELNRQAAKAAAGSDFSEIAISV